MGVTFQQPPEGFVPAGTEQPPTSFQPPPEGFTPAATPEQPSGEGFLSKVAEAAGNVALGGLKSAGETLNAIGGVAVNPIYKAVTGKEAPPSSIPPPEGTAQKVGAFGEQVAEWFTGEEALKGLALLERFPEAAKILAKLPGGQTWVAKLMASATRSGAVGATEGLLHPEGQTPEKAAVTGAAGGAAGALAGEAIAKALPEIPGLIHGRLTAEELEAKPFQAKFQPAANVTNRDVLDFAAQHDIQLTPGEATQSKFRQGMEGLGRRAIGGNILEDAIQKNRTKLGDAISSFTNRLDPAAQGVSEESTGAALKNSVETAKNAVRQRMHAAYGALPLELQDTVVDVRPIWAEWSKLLNEKLGVLETLKRGGNEAAAAELERPYTMARALGTVVEDRIVPRMSFADALKLRETVGKLGATAPGELADSVDALYKRLYGDMTEAMHHAANSAGFDADWSAANNIASKYHLEFGNRQSPLYRIITKTDPAEAARTMTNRMSANDIQVLQRAGVDLRPLKRLVVNDIFKSGAKVNSSGLGGYSDAFLSELLGPAKDELYRAAEVGRRLGFEINPSGTSNVLANEWALHQVIAGASALFTYPPALAGVAAVPAAVIAASVPKDVAKFLPRAVTPAEVAARNAVRAAGGTAARITFRASDGSVHSVPANQLEHAKQIDPGLEVIQ